jgi:hypothetical protein
MISSAVTFEAITFSKCSSPERQYSTVFDAQMVLQPQLVPYEEHNLVYL